MKYVFTLCLLCLLTMAYSQHHLHIDSVKSNSSDAIHVEYAGSNGLNIRGTGNTGVVITNPGFSGVLINTAGDNGIDIRDPKVTGLKVYNPGDDGIYLYNPGSNGIEVRAAGSDGVYIHNPAENGVYINAAGDHGIYVYEADGFSMNIQGDKSLFRTPGVKFLPEQHIAQIYNRNNSIGTEHNMLAIKTGLANPGSITNFITFFDGDDQALGSIEGNGSGGITYNTSGADFAECLEPCDPDDRFLPGDVVGIFEGKISHRTQGASDVMVITDQAAVLGNNIENTQTVPVSFIGQVPVSVFGQVKAGDWIVASGLEDGTALSVPVEDLTREDRIIGRAWESHTDPGLKKINTVVGLDQSESKDVLIRLMQQRIDLHEELIYEQAQDLLDLKMEMDMMKKLILENGLRDQ